MLRPREVSILVTMIGSITALSPPAQAVPCGQFDQPFCAYYTLPNLFHNQFDTHRITFDTLPNGQPSVSGTFITPSFNWTAQGVTFSPNVGGIAIIATTDPPFFALNVANYGVPDSLRNWLNADLAPPVRAVGVTAAGITRVYAYDTLDNLLGSALTGYFGVTQSFVGLASDVPIARIRVDHGGNGEAIYEFQFTPIPEPATVLLLFAAAPLLRRASRPRPSKKHSPLP